MLVHLRRKRMYTHISERGHIDPLAAS